MLGDGADLEDTRQPLLGSGIEAAAAAAIQQGPAAEQGQSHSLQGSVGQQHRAGSEGGVDSRRASGSWLLGGLGTLAAVFRRNAVQV